MVDKNREKTKEKLKKIESYDTERPLVKEIMFHFYKTNELINEAKDRNAILEKDYQGIKNKFENLEDELIEKGIIEEN